MGTHRIAIAAVVAFFALARIASAEGAPIPDAADAGPPAALPACIQVSTESRYVPFGYNHLVVVKNGCSRVASCTVATDVNPERQTVEVGAGASATVTTFLGSASQTFTARVGCVLR